MEKVWKQAYSLEAFTAPEQFKSYDDLENRLNSVLGARPSTRQAQEDEEYVPTIAGAPVTIDNSNAPKASVDEDDALSYFQKLAND